MKWNAESGLELGPQVDVHQLSADDLFIEDCCDTIYRATKDIDDDGCIVAIDTETNETIMFGSAGNYPAYAPTLFLMVKHQTA
jgi:hypothetical protein